MSKHPYHERKTRDAQRALVAEKRVAELAQDERHHTVAETRYWCQQYRTMAEQLERERDEARAERDAEAENARLMQDRVIRLVEGGTRLRALLLDCRDELLQQHDAEDALTLVIGVTRHWGHEMSDPRTCSACGMPTDHDPWSSSCAETLQTQRDRLRWALQRVRAHTSWRRPTDGTSVEALLTGLLSHIEEIVDATIGGRDE